MLHQFRHEIGGLGEGHIGISWLQPQAPGGPMGCRDYMAYGNRREKTVQILTTMYVCIHVYLYIYINIYMSVSVYIYI